ncbi:hypothetical protein BGX26_004754, partial [Mortierella sp. AD094]
MDSDIPSIDAIFVVRFDTRQGNVLEWSNSVPGIDLKGVEFSALPSGLHGSSQDVIYFQLDGCIGVSVFANVPSSNAEHRGAQMVSVGVIVKPSGDTGRCGQVWRHVDFLKNQAKYHACQDSETVDLVSYFTRHKTLLHAAGPSSSSSKRDSYRARNVRRISRSFTLSEPIQPITPTFAGQHELLETEDIPLSHPSHHFLRLVQTMGPSIFILWKAALLRKRILIYTQPPVEGACLFGTTDKLFLFKPQLYDILVDISAPPNSTGYSADKSTYPRIRVVKGGSKGHETEEWRPNTADNSRYFALLQRLGRSRRRHEWMQRRLYAEAASSETDHEADGSAAMQGPEIRTMDTDGFLSEGGFNMSDTLRKMVTGGWWWWYGGSGTEDDSLESLMPSTAAQGPEHGYSSEGAISSSCLQILHTRAGGSPDTEAIRFFHNLTSTLLSELGRLVALKETEAIFDDAEQLSSVVNEDTSYRVIEISNREIRDLGLDPCKDGEFIKDVTQLYFSSKVQLQGSEFGVWCHNL